MAETLNFHRAAERPHITQPSLSRSIRRLENDIGVELFMRTQRQVQLSAAGRVLVPEAQQLLSYARRTEALLNDLHNGQAGTLRIGFLASTAIALLPKLLREVPSKLPSCSPGDAGNEQRRTVAGPTRQPDRYRPHP
nr:LysR family transcriptional regulator [Acidithiobacillus ferrooxidans]